jgi:dipeptidase E
MSNNPPAILRRIYMFGGIDVVGGQISPLDQRWLAEANGKPICIIDLTNKDAARLPRFRSIMEAHFSGLTASQLVFVSEQPSREDILNAIDRAGAIYIPGGDTEALLDNLAEQNLFSVLKSSKLPLIGNSAGAIAVCQDAVITADEDVKTSIVRAGLGLVHFSVDPHYDQTHDQELFELSKGREIYGLPEQSAIIAEDNSIEFFGPIWLFANGCKQRVN